MRRYQQNVAAAIVVIATARCVAFTRRGKAVYMFDRQTDSQTDRQTDRQTDSQTDGQTFTSMRLRLPVHWS